MEREKNENSLGDTSLGSEGPGALWRLLSQLVSHNQAETGGASTLLSVQWEEGQWGQSPLCLSILLLGF